ncbi:transport protein particle TRAPP component [Nitzschia inconspicua]|uniref:Transport protein particle TRAPP component n=1 Tax=Nitzschia inconspicua TaxID=303405 RepID=A0A9K3PDS7_9STRA|nr:transport protein particle TRAPP component [Nitzschia inconspicua]
MSKSSASTNGAALWAKTPKANAELFSLKFVDEFLAKSNAAHCRSLQDTAQVLGRTAFKMFLGIDCDVQILSPTTFSLIMQENPLYLFVELPENYKETLQYAILYCGIIRGALEMLNYKVECTLVKNILKGDDVDEIKVELKQILQDGAGDDYKED